MSKEKIFMNHTSFSCSFLNLREAAPGSDKSADILENQSIRQ